MQPSSMLGTGGVQGMSSVTACLSSGSVGFQGQSMHSQQQQQQQQQHQQQQHFPSQFEQTNPPQMDDFIEQMFSSWPEVAVGKTPWEFNNGAPNNNQNLPGNSQKLFTMSLLPNEDHARENLQYPSYDESMLASRLRQHQLGNNSSLMNSSGINETNTSPGRSMVLQLSTGNATHLLASMASSSRGTPVMTRSPTSGGSDGGMLPLPLSLGQGKQEDIEATFKSTNHPRDSNPGGMFTAIVGSTRPVRPAGPNFHQGGQMAMQSAYGGLPQTQHQHQHQHPPPNAVGAAPARPRVRARRGQATDPHSIAERLRRERIAERMKSLQELVPNSNKTDKASMLDEIIDYVKFLQLQVKVLSMSRLGGAGAVAPLVADIPSEGSNNPQSGRTNGSQSSSQDGLALTERQVAKLMEEDMGSAMQYLQSKGLCLMPISLASAISSSGSRSHSAATNPSLQGLVASINVADRQLIEPTNSGLSASSMSIQPTISSPGSGITESDNNNAKSGTRNPKDSREANSIAKSNGLGPNLSMKGEE
ncbi:hypothetical protein KI387_019928 [Taxus chinensis]|uniref:BHLH domain-containing protein n=1 Tax=Taxus chinensis TaxID=29808 RepID=A0AA38G730_TAXCH|nr:hypothetical protein KI387_019928 [Taxus chinensis]